MDEIIKELISGLMPIIIVVVASLVYLAIRNKLRGKKWNHLDEDTSCKM